MESSTFGTVRVPIGGSFRAVLVFRRFWCRHNQWTGDRIEAVRSYAEAYCYLVAKALVVVMNYWDEYKAYTVGRFAEVPADIQVSLKRVAGVEMGRIFYATAFTQFLQKAIDGNTSISFYDRRDPIGAADAQSIVSLSEVFLNPEFWVGVREKRIKTIGHELARNWAGQTGPNDANAFDNAYVWDAIIADMVAYYDKKTHP